MLLLGLAFRNSLTRLAVIHVGSRILATRIEVDEVDIRWSSLSISQIEIFEPEIANERQLTVERVRLVPSLWNGLRTGVWLADVEVTSPTVEVRFDQSGQLLSVFPSGGEPAESSGPIKIPVGKATIRDAELIVHQVGRDRLHVVGVDLNMTADDRINLNLNVPDLIGARCEVRCDVDAQSFEGVSHVNINQIHLDSNQFAKLPLIPTALVREPCSVDAELKIVAYHPPDEPDARKHFLQCNVWTANAKADRLGMICERLDLSVKCSSGRAEANLSANPLGGTWKLTSSIDLLAIAPELIMQSTLKGCQPAALAKAIPPLKRLRANTNASTEGKIVLENGIVRFDGNAVTRVADSSFDDIALPELKATVRVDGTMALDDPESLKGLVRGSMASESFDLAALARSLGLPVSSAETVTNAEFAVPLDSVDDVATYWANVSVGISKVETADLRLDDASLAAQLSAGVVTVGVEKLALRDTRDYLLAAVESTTTVSLTDDGRLDSALSVYVEPSVEIARALGVDTLDPGGRVLARLTASCPTNQATDPASWQANAQVQTQALSALGETISDINWRANLIDSKLQCTPLTVAWRGHELVANTSASLGSSLRVDGNASVDSVRLAEVSEVLSRFSETHLPLDGLASVLGSFVFAKDLSSGHQTFQATGSANLNNASYARTRIGQANLKWSADMDGLTLGTSSPDFLGGRFDVTARMKELDWTRTQVDGNFDGVETARLIGMAGQSIPTTGTIDGGFRLTSIANIESLTGDAWLSTKQVSVNRVPLRVNRATVAVDRGELLMNAVGTIVDGTFNASAGGTLPRLVAFSKQSPIRIARVPVTADVTLTGLRAESLIRPLGLPREARAASARLSANCIRTAAAWDGRHVFLASATVEDLRYNHQGLSQRMSVETVLHPNRIEVSAIRGRFADGMLSGSGEVTLTSTPQGRFDVSASHVNLRRATSPLGVKDVTGTGTLRVRGRIGPVISGQLDASVDNFSAAGVAVRKAKFPVDWSFRPAANLARWQCRAGTASVGGGNVRIATEGSFSNAISATTSVRMENIDLAKLMQNGSAGSGIISGNMTVRAKNARAADDLVGSFAMQLKNIEAMQFPVLDQLPKLVTLGPPVPGHGQDGGTVRGRIAGGLVHLDEVAIHQSNVQVLVTGNATMSGKLNLDVVASTESTGPADQLVSLLDSPVMLAAPAPVALVVKANELLKDRVVRVHVGGTADRPTLRLQPGKQLSQDAVRFFLSSSLGPAADRLSQSQSNRQRR